MNHVERFRRIMQFQPVDRLPVIEWASWWDQTLTRWRGEGLPAELQSGEAIRAHLGLDPWLQFWIPVATKNCPRPESHGAGIVASPTDYDTIKPHLFSDALLEPALFRPWAQRHAVGEAVIWVTVSGFYWHPRTLLGIERHMLSFYDQADLMHRMNANLADFNLRMLDRWCREICVPDFMTFAEDLSYNNGPMLSKKHFDTFLAPYYRRIVPWLKERGIVPFIDSDGDITKVIPWFEEVGVTGILPLERMAGVDLPTLRKTNPRAQWIGGFDKMTMKHGEAAMRAEFERLLPVMRSGGYIPSVDHQTPPDVSLKTYRTFVRLLTEYAARATH